AATQNVQFDVSMRGNRFSRMRTFSAFCAAALTAATLSPPHAADPDAASEKPAAAATTEAATGNRLDALFGQLKRERNEKAAERIASRISEEWNHSGSASIDLMMTWSQTAMEGKKFDVALDFLDQ